jgi:hypothetical protein
MYYQANYQQLNHGHVGRPGNEETIIRHVSKIEVSCNNLSSVSGVSDNSFYRSNHVEGQYGGKNIVMKLVSPYRDGSKLAADAGSVAYPHYEDHLIARYSQHQISSPSGDLQGPQFRFTPPQRSSPPCSGNCGGHASSPEPSVSPPTGVDRSSSDGSCVSSLSEPVAVIDSSGGSSGRLTSYHGRKKILDLEEVAVSVGAFAQRYATGGMSEGNVCVNTSSPFLLACLSIKCSSR